MKDVSLCRLFRGTALPCILSSKRSCLRDSDALMIQLAGVVDTAARGGTDTPRRCWGNGRRRFPRAEHHPQGGAHPAPLRQEDCRCRAWYVACLSAPSSLPPIQNQKKAFNVRRHLLPRRPRRRARHQPAHARRGAEARGGLALLDRRRGSGRSRQPEVRARFSPPRYLSTTQRITSRTHFRALRPLPPGARALPCKTETFPR